MKKHQPQPFVWPDYSKWENQRSQCLRCAHANVILSKTRDAISTVMRCNKARGLNLMTCIAQRTEGECGPEGRWFEEKHE